MSKSGRTRLKVEARSRVTSSSHVCDFGCLVNHGSHITTEASDGYGYIHKSKANSNGSFSVGKTWKLDDLKSVQIVNVRNTHPLSTS